MHVTTHSQETPLFGGIAQLVERLTVSNQYTARLICAEIMHRADDRRLCRECGRSWPCRTFKIVSGR